MVLALLGILPNPRGEIKHLRVSLLVHVKPEILQPLPAPPGQELHEDVDHTVLKMNVSILDTFNRQVTEMVISNNVIISVLESLKMDA